MYLNWRILEAVSPWLSYPFRAVHASYLPTPDRDSRNRSILKTADQVFGNEFSRLYMPKLLSVSDQNHIKSLISEEKSNFKSRINASVYLSEIEKKLLIRKTDELLVTVSHHVTLNSLVKIEFSRTDFLGNLFKASAWKTRQDLKRAFSGREAIKVSEYLKGSNELVLNAGILLQPLASRTDESWNKIRSAIRNELASQILGHSGIGDSSTLRDLLVTL